MRRMILLLLLLSLLKLLRQGYECLFQKVKNAKSVLTIVEAGQQKQLELLQSIKEKVVQIQDATLTSAQRTIN